MITEGDGPIGAALLGRSLAVALDATPVFLTEVTNIPRMAELVRATGLEIVDVDLARTTSFKAAIVPLPIDPKRAVAAAKELFDSANPKAMVSIEKPAPSPAGTYHTGPGLDVSDVVGKVDIFVDEAKARGVLTIGIGDGGNEVGMGMILKDVHEVVPTGKIMGTKVSTDILVVAAIANWGAYAIEACLAAALHLPEALHPLAVEQRVADASSRAGLIDPTSGIAHGWVDGKASDLRATSILELLRAMVELQLDRKLRANAMTSFGRRWFEIRRRPRHCEGTGKGASKRRGRVFRRQNIETRRWARSMAALRCEHISKFAGERTAARVRTKVQPEAEQRALLGLGQLASRTGCS